MIIDFTGVHFIVHLFFLSYLLQLKVLTEWNIVLFIVKSGPNNVALMSNIQQHLIVSLKCHCMMSDYVITTDKFLLYRYCHFKV